MIRTAERIVTTVAIIMVMLGVMGGLHLLYTVPEDQLLADTIKPEKKLSAFDLNYSDHLDPTRADEYREINNFLGERWNISTKDVFCAGETRDVNSCHDRLEFSIEAKDFDQKEYEKVISLWKEKGRGRELYNFDHPEYRLYSVDILFGFPREKGIPENLVVIFDYWGEKGSLYSRIRIYNDNLEWQYPIKRFFAFEPCFEDTFCKVEDGVRLRDLMNKIEIPKE